MEPNKYVLKVFENLLGNVEPWHMVNLVRDVQEHLEEIREAGRHKALLSVELAEEIAGKLLALLGQLGQLPVEQQQLVVGAARYFVSKDDVNPDTESVLGLDDDASLFNYVAERVGRPDLSIDLG